jgi:diguanylate cyclase (GGDEF)-like protein
VTSATVRNLESGDELTDPITGLPRPGVFQEHLHLALRRSGENARPVGMVVVDIDGFGRVDEQWGWGTGDAVLQEVGQRLLAVLRDPDMATRLGGDRFAISCEDLEDPLHVEALRERIAETLAHPVVLGSMFLYLTVSLGTAVSTPGMSGHSLVARAEQAMLDSRP